LTDTPSGGTVEPSNGGHLGDVAGSVKGVTPTRSRHGAGGYPDGPIAPQAEGDHMTANIMVVVERQFDYPRPAVFRAWTAPEETARWRGSPGWHVETETNTADLRLGGRHHHVKVRDNDPTTRVTTDGVFTEYFDPDVFVSRERISGDPGIDPDIPLELRVEFTKTGRDGTLVRIVQGPYEPDVAGYHSRGWELELNRLEAHLAGRRTEEMPR
jgi:uncharacterized protein YndB with AHSA1/START domain